MSWRWCFYVSLPIGAVTLGALALFFRPPSRQSEKAPLREKILKIDLVGLAMVSPPGRYLVLTIRLDFQFCCGGTLLTTTVHTSDRHDTPRTTMGRPPARLGFGDRGRPVIWSRRPDGYLPLLGVSKGR